MSNSGFVPVVPVASGGPPRDKRQHKGPLKEMMTQQDSLYKYISWEDPALSLGSYFGALGLLCGIHYLPLTHLALKMVTVTLGVVTVTEFVCRSFTHDTILARMRPKNYHRIPEAILNDTLHDIHDFVQYTVVTMQKVFMAENLTATSIAFGVSFVLFWVIRMLSPFGLAILGLTSLFIAPLVASPQGREIADSARVRAGELANAAAENGKALAQDGKEKAAQLSSRAQDAVQSSKETTTGLAKQAQDTVLNIPKATVDSVKNLPEIGNKAVERTQNSISSTVDDTKSSTEKSPANALDGITTNNESITGQIMTGATQMSNAAADTARGVIPNSILGSTTAGPNTSYQSRHQPGTNSDETEDNYGDSTHYHATASDHIRQPVTVVSNQLGGGVPRNEAESTPKNRIHGDTAAHNDVMDRPRGITLPDTIQ